MDFDQVFFLPHIGKEYFISGFRGKRVLLIGESHYTDWSVSTHNLERTHTQECIAESVQGIRGSSFWNKVRYRLGGEEHRTKPASEFWEAVAFYNFIQSPVTGAARQRPTPTQWSDALPAFQEVLTALRPDRVWVIGRELWNHMPRREGQLKSIAVREAVIPIEWYAFEDGHKAFVTSTAHPASSHFYRSLETALQQFVDQDWALDLSPPHVQTREPGTV